MNLSTTFCRLTAGLRATVSLRAVLQLGAFARKVRVALNVIQRPKAFASRLHRALVVIGLGELASRSCGPFAMVRLPIAALASRARIVRAIAALTMMVAVELSARAVAATADFAQSSENVIPTPADARRLSTYFSPPYKSGPLPAAVEEMLLRDAPAELRAGCAAMVAGWRGRARGSWDMAVRRRDLRAGGSEGEPARDGGAAAARGNLDAAMGDAALRGSSRVSVRILAVAGGSAWVAYRCDSRLPQFEDRYSERLAVFNAARGALRFLDLKANEDTAATLYHVGLATTLKLHGAEDSASFVVFATGFNPALEPARKPSGHAEFARRSAQSQIAIRSEESPDPPQAQPDVKGRAQSVPAGSASDDEVTRAGPDNPALNPPAPRAPAENRLVVIANSASVSKPVLALVTARQSPSVRTDEADSRDDANEDEYRAGLRYEHDLAGYLTAVSGFYRAAGPGGRVRFGVIRFVWNPAALSFAPAKPIPIHRPKRGLPVEQLSPHRAPVFERLPPVPGYHPAAPGGHAQGD